MRKVTVSYAKDVNYVSVDQSVAGATVLVAASDGKKHKVLGCVLTMSVVGTVQFTDTTGDLTGDMNVAETGGFVLATGIVPYFESHRGEPLNLVTTGGLAKGVVAVLTEE